MSDTGTILDRPEQIRVAGMLQLVHRLAIEIKTGMKFRGSTLKLCQVNGFTKARTKHAALVDMVAALKVAWPEYEPSKSVQAALDS